MSLVKLADRQVGWQSGNDVVATVRMERDGDELLVLELDFDDADSACLLLDAVADVATTERIVGTREELGAFGFTREEGRWVRQVAVKPIDAPPPVTLARLEQAVRASWAADTSEEPDVWTEENPAFGNCVVTALVVRDYLGGELLVAGVVRDGRRIDRHVWNLLASGLEVDLSRDQFRDGETYERAALLTESLVDGTRERYELLSARVRAYLGR